MSKLKPFSLIVILLSVAGCATATTDSSSLIGPVGSAELNKPNKAFNSTEVVPSAAPYVASLNALSKDFYNALFDGGNKIYSTVSLANCFSMLYEGTKENSAAQLKSFLHYDDTFNHLDEIKNALLRNAIDDKNNETYLDVAQSFWVDNSFKEGINPDYIDTLTNYYYAEAFSGVLESDGMHQKLADYINDKTRNFLNVKKDDFASYGGVLWLLNTIYLKSKWLSAFEESDNIKGTFANLNNTTKEVTFMNQYDDCYYQAADNYAIASLPLKHGLNYNILLPNEGTNYTNVLTSEAALNDLHNFTQYKNTSASLTSLRLKVPQFKITESIDLVTLLQEKMGVTDIFNPLTANLGNLVKGGNSGLYVTKAKHQAGIELKNDGLEAAAYTIIEVGKAMPYIPKTYTEFFVDRPFAYSITNADGIPLFTGVTTTL